MSQLPNQQAEPQGQSNLPQQNVPQQQNQQQFIPQQGQTPFILPSGQIPQMIFPQQNAKIPQIIGNTQQPMSFLQQFPQQTLPQQSAIGQIGAPYQTGPVQLSSQLLTDQAVKGESRIEYVPFERVITEYEEVRRQVQVPITKQVTDYYAVQYEIEYIPQIIQEKQIEYVPVEKIQERMEYYTVQKQNILPGSQYTQQEIQGTSQMIQTQRVQQPVIQQYAMPQTTTTVIPQTTVLPQQSTYIQQAATTIIPQATTTTVAPPTQYVQQIPQNYVQPQTMAVQASTLLPQTSINQTYFQQQSGTTLQPQTLQTTTVVPPQRTITRPGTQIQGQIPITQRFQPQSSIPFGSTTAPVLAQTTVMPTTQFTRGTIQPNSLYTKTIPPMQPGQTIQTIAPQQVQPEKPATKEKSDKDKTFLDRLFE